MITIRDIDYLALTIFGEARGEANAGRLAVAATVRNRLRSGRWGKTYRDVCLARKQFSCWNSNDPNRVRLEKLAEQLRSGETIADKAFVECRAIAECIGADSTLSPVRNATHYYAPAGVRKPPPWAATGSFVSVIGGHMFFEDVA